MQNLRIISVTVVDSSSINVKFSSKLTSNLITSNVSIVSETINVPDSSVLKIAVNGDTLQITCQPLTQFASYVMQFQSTTNHPFISVNGDAKILEDGISNYFAIVGPIDPESTSRDFFKSYFINNIYNLDDDNTIISKYIQSLSTILDKSLHDIGQVKNENYLSFDVIDEEKIRSAGPFDRLNEEGAYEIIRVGRTPISSNAQSTFLYDSFPSYPISLSRQIVSESLLPDSVDANGIFNVNSLVFNLSNSPVIKVTSIVFTFTTTHPIYTYDISKFGYQIKNSRYDQDFAFSYDLLNNNQIKISDKVLEDPNFSLANIFKIDIQYEYKNLGIIVNQNTVNVFSNIKSIREVLPPIINIFDLSYAPLLDTSNQTPISGGVIFTDPNAINPGDVHPAFKIEIPFRLSTLPFSPGQYSIDYSTGRVYVYGSDNKNDGTGPYPPLATYNYKLIYKFDVDYSYDIDSQDLVALPFGSLLSNSAYINFSYEQVLIPDVDYVASVHKESLNERVNNRIAALNAVKPTYTPITNVFRVYNETSGELYTISRWSNDKIYYTYNTPPNITSTVHERVAFQNIINELLFVDSYVTNTSSLKVIKILLKNNRIGSLSEDSVASSVNSSLNFSKSNIFINERWFDRGQSATANLNKLINVGEYCVDYVDGIIYCSVSNTQGQDIGTISYKTTNIIPTSPHLISVDDIYYQISVLSIKDKQFKYTSFDDGIIVPEIVDYSDETSLNNNVGAPYQVSNNQVGIFNVTTFLPGLTYNIKSVRGLFVYDDIINNINPLNFGSFALSSNNQLMVKPIIKQVFDTVVSDMSGLHVTINENIPYFSSNITYNFSVVRLSDSAQLWNLSGTIIPGNPVKLILPGINSPVVGDSVIITYTFTINNLSRVVADYNKGDYYIDYSYLADEILISYEYGDNNLDFRQGKVLSSGDTYFVTYRAGALRDALVQNFGTLINVPELETIDVDFNRERYREALYAGLSSFVQGPTVSAMKNIGKIISHIEPEIIESIFQNWSLGTSLLNPESIKTTGQFALIPAKYGNAALVSDSNQTIKLPLNSNLRLENGTFEEWVIPNWNGLDNDAILTFNILKNGTPIPSNQVFIGAAENHPQIYKGEFTASKSSSVMGTPNKNKDGIFIYYDKDVSGNFYRWYLDFIDGYSDGYVDGYADGYTHNYKLKISSTGKFYDLKSLTVPKPNYLNIFTGVNFVTINVQPTHKLNETLTFVSDVDHYLLDFGEEENRNRLSIFKDPSGYFNFRIFDRRGENFTVSADVSKWRAGEQHYVSASWKLNSKERRDEMHLFIDGFEVPNIIKYGEKLRPYLHENFRTVNPEEVVGLAARDIVGSNDLVTIFGNNTVSSSINFSVFNIFPGDTIFIDEIGFNPSGYTILSISGQTLTLSTTMPLSLTNVRFSVNRTNYSLTSEIDIYPNIAVSILTPTITASDLILTLGSNIVTSSSINFTSSNVLPGYVIKIDNMGLEVSYTILSVNNYSLTISANIPISSAGSVFYIYPNVEQELHGKRAIRKDYSISKDINFQNILTISNGVNANDLILIRTLGLNHQRTRGRYYVWSNQVQNILMTKLPPPISLDEAKIFRVILPKTLIGPTNSTLSAGVFVSNNLSCAQPSNAQQGRTLSVIISGTNVDFSVPVKVTINGVVGINTISEDIYFNDYGTLNFTNYYVSINYIKVTCKPLNPAKSFLNIDVKEKYEITKSELSGLVPVIKFSYQIKAGYNLMTDGYATVRDNTTTFSALSVGNYLVINQPPAVAGYYKITGISADRHSLTIASTYTSFPLPLASFTNGVYQILDVIDARSGLQNGFFTLEQALMPGQPYFMDAGFYELDYFTYTSIELNPQNSYIYFGSDFKGHNQIHALMDQIKIYSEKLTDTRIGETVAVNQRSITKDFNSLKALKKDQHTLALINFDVYPFTNDSDYYLNYNNKKFIQSSSTINDNFGYSLVITNDPVIVDNAGILDTKKEGSIEFWINPFFDTGNDPVDRFYFDAFGAVIEETISLNEVSIKLSKPAEQIVSVKLKNGDPHIDYFAGGSLDIDLQNAISQQTLSFNDSTIIISQKALQIISVKIVNDFSGVDYFDGGVIGPDGTTLYLGKPLPQNNLLVIVIYKPLNSGNNTLNSQIIRLNKKLPEQISQVIVTYIPRGLQGDRISIFKDTFGYLNFAIRASHIDYVLRAPTFWTNGTWHRVKASYKINSNKDEMRLFADGYEWGNVLFGTSATFGDFPFVMGSSFAGDGYDGYDGYGILGNISFKDPINNFFIGSQYTHESPAYVLIDNLRISNISRPIYAPYGEPRDVNYTKNLDVAFPVTTDLYTTYLSDFDAKSFKNTDFVTLKNKKNGLFDFSMNIFDSFGIINSSPKVKLILEELIKILKPASSRVFLKYII